MVQQAAIQRERAGAEGHESEAERQNGQGKFESAGAGEAMRPMHQRDGNRHIDGGGQSGQACEQAGNQQQPTDEFSGHGEVGQPAGQVQAFDQMNVTAGLVEDLVPAMHGQN